MNSIDWFGSVVRAPSDRIYGVQEDFTKDPRTHKINLSIGVYRDPSGRPYVPPSVVRAEQIVLSKNMHKEYAPIEGFADFREATAKLVFGECSDIVVNERHATVQGLGGTGSLRIGALFLKGVLPQTRIACIPEQTWSAHNQVFGDSGFQISHYRYWDPNTLSLGFDSFMQDLARMSAHSVVVLHSVAHNPTGMDPTLEQWQQIIDLLKTRHLFPFLDIAYQGFVSGSIEEDGRVIELFAKQLDQFIIATTFAKNMGLYGERIGALSVVCKDRDQSIDVLSQLKRIIRPMYSHPPNHGARVVTQLLNDPELKSQWFEEVKNMQKRITSMRQILVKELTLLSRDKHYWHFILRQRGMYCYSGLTEDEVTNLRQTFGVYSATDGRINVAAVNENNVKQIAEAIHGVKKC